MSVMLALGQGLLNKVSAFKIVLYTISHEETKKRRPLSYPLQRKIVLLFRNLPLKNTGSLFLSAWH